MARIILGEMVEVQRRTGKISGNERGSREEKLRRRGADYRI